MPTVYALRDPVSGYVKIGRSVDVAKRMKTLHTGRSKPLDVICTIETESGPACESYIHDRLSTDPASRRVRDGAGTEFFDVSPDYVHRIFAEAREFVDQFKDLEEQVADLSKVKPKAVLKSPDETTEEIYRELWEVKSKIKMLQWQQDHLENQLKTIIAASEGIKGIATWKLQVAKRFQAAEFKADNPKLYLEYVAEIPSRVFRLQS